MPRNRIEQVVLYKLHSSAVRTVHLSTVLVVLRVVRDFQRAVLHQQLLARFVHARPLQPALRLVLVVWLVLVIGGQCPVHAIVRIFTKERAESERRHKVY